MKSNISLTAGFCLYLSSSVAERKLNHVTTMTHTHMSHMHTNIDACLISHLVRSKYKYITVPNKEKMWRQKENKFQRG